MSPRFKRIIPNDTLEPFFLGVDGFCADFLAAGTSESTAADTRKIIADPVEGYCSLEGWEIAIIDTPLFQRLRSIRQLGLAFLVYPTLGYSRFEHVIGVRARLDQVLSTLRENETFRAAGATNLPNSLQALRMRLAVLCHDIGHCLFSHVSEAVVAALPGDDQYPPSSAVLSAFADLAGHKIPMAEVLSVSILTSPRFIQFLQDIGIPHAGKRESPERIANDAAHLIMGIPIPHDPQSLFLAQLMNSGLDLDKLDYMMRESLLSGITLGISLQWLMKKLFIATMPADRIPAGLRPRVSGFPGDQQYAVLSLERGGQFAFEEFCVARLTLHEKIYLHQKIRAAEAQVRTALLRLAQQAEGYSEAHRWLYLKEAMIDCPDVRLPLLPDRNLFTSGIRTARPLDLHRIRDRILLARAYAFGWQNSIADPIDRQDRDFSVDRLMRLTREDPGTFVSQIRAVLARIASLLKGEPPVTAIEILVDPPRLSTIQQGLDTIHIEYPTRLSLRWTMPVDRIEDYYLRNRALGYVFADRPVLPYVCLAAEMAAWEQCEVVCIQDGLINKDVLDRVRDLKLALHEQGFYAKARPLQPVTAYVSSIEAQILIHATAEKLSPYESRGKTRVTPASITVYVSQFPEHLQAPVLEWIQSLQIIRPDGELRSLLRTAFSCLPPECTTAGLSPLGGATDSASRISYDLRELGDVVPDNFRVLQLPLPEALGMRLSAYLIYDDNTNTGLQALNIVASWLGKELPLALQLREEHVHELSDEQKQELLSKQVLFLFAVATEGATDRLKKLLVEHCGLASEKVQCHASVVLRERDRVFSGPDSPFQHSSKIALRDFVSQVASDVFAAEGKDAATAEARLLGDNHAEAMVVFPYNCPTMTIPALWIRGKRGDQEWEPLVERTRRANPITGELMGEDAWS